MGDSVCPYFTPIFSELVLGHCSCLFQEDPMSEESSRTLSTHLIQLWHFSRALETCVQSASAKSLQHIFRIFSQFYWAACPVITVG